MQDDFAALDLLSVGAFAPASHSARASREKKKRFGKFGKAAKITKSREVNDFLPLIQSKLGPLPKSEDLQGWPVTLSWPGQEKPAPRGLPVKSRDERSDNHPEV